MSLVLAVCAGLTLGYTLLLVAVAPTDWLSLGNMIGPGILCVTCLWCVYRTIKVSSLALWTPIPWFLTACTVFFGLGPLVYHFGSAESVSYLHGFVVVDELALLRTNLLNVVGIGFITVGFLVSRAAFAQGRWSVRIRPFNYFVTLRLTFIILAIGISVKYVFVIPYSLGLISWTLPGGIQYLSSFTKIAIILLFVLIHRGKRHYMWLLFSLIGMELVTALMTLYKTAVFEVIIAIGLGWYLKRPSFRMLAVNGVVIGLLYVFFLSPFVLFARVAANSVGVGSVAEVSQLVVDYAEQQKDDLVDSSGGVQGWWTRLSYSNTQTFVMDAYDQGAEGESIGLIAYTFLPRLLFPDKPTMTPGRNFTALITGEFTETATSAGLFGEAYWNGGWMFVFLVCLCIGILFTGFTIFAERTITAEKYEYLPVVMSGISMGYSPCDWIAVTYFGPLANAIVLYVMFRYFIMPLIRTSMK